jgi:uncharacterized repeat protein (TIGR01451 family)
MRRAAIVLCLLASATVGLWTTQATTALAAPGVPGAGTTVYQETFANDGGAAATPVQSYSGNATADNESYTAAPYWQAGTDCNGWILDATTPIPTTDPCVSTINANGLNVWSNLQNLDGVLGQADGMGANNFAVSEQTGNSAAGGPANAAGAELKTTTDSIPMVTGDFYDISAYFGVIDYTGTTGAGCDLSDPSLTFSLLSPTLGAEPIGTGLDPCTAADATLSTVDGRNYVSSNLTSSTFRWPAGAGSTAGLELDNANDAVGGNDSAFSDPVVENVTPVLSKSFSPGTEFTDQPATLTFTVTNTMSSNGALEAKDGWSFTDSLPSGLKVANPADTSTTCSSTTVSATAGGTSINVPSGDLNAGQAFCTVTVDVSSITNGPGSYTNGPGNVTESGLQPPTPTTVNFQGDPKVSIVKHATVSPAADQSAAKLGDKISYSYTVTNSGNTTLASVSVSDPTVGTVTCPTPAAPGLAPGASETCTANSTVTVTTKDIDGGQVSDTATATGTDIYGETSPTSAPSTAVVPTVKPAPAVAIQKIATVTPAADQAGVKSGDSIQYTYNVTNRGNVDLSTIAVSDPSIGAVDCPVPASPGLAPGASETCTADTTYTVTQGDVNNGEVTDTATATGVDPAGNKTPVANPSSTTVPAVTPAPAITIQKIAAAQNGDQTAITVGETIQYSYDVTNTGNVTLSAVAVSDPTGGTVTCPSASLAPGQSETCKANNPYTVTQTDVDRGGVTDTATASGTPPATHPPGTSPTSGVTSQPSSVTVPSDPNPQVRIQKAGTVSPAADQSKAKLGDTIAYTYAVTNVGNVDLTSVSVSDPTIGAVTCPTPTAPGLAPGASETCTANSAYKVTQADVDTGLVKDTATATGTDPTGTSSPASPPSSVMIPTVAAAPSVSVVKTAHVTPHAEQKHAEVGDKITYTYKVTNTGNVDLKKVKVYDPALGTVVCPAPAAPGLAPGHSEVCKGKRAEMVTSKNAKAGKVTDVATASGTDTRGQTSGPSKRSQVTVPVVLGRLTLKKTASAGTVRAGHNVTYTLKVADPTKVAVSDVKVCDRLPSRLIYVGSKPAAHTAAGGYCWSIAKLGAHASRSFKITATVALGSGAKVENTATATGHNVKTVKAHATIKVIAVPVVGCSLARSAGKHESRTSHMRPAC